MSASARLAIRDCSVFAAGETIGDAWSWLLLSQAIIDGTCRFDDFQGQLGIARSTLSARLAALCDNGLMQRQRLEYRLTEMGQDFFGCVMTSTAWTNRWCDGDRDVLPTVSHVGCADRIVGELRCATCHEVVAARDVSFNRRPGPPAALSGGQQRRRAPDVALLARAGPSPVAATLHVVGDRWSALLIRELFYGSHRFDEFQQNLNIATNILAQRLRRLVDMGIAGRTPYQHRPTRHEYRLTAKGLDLYPVPLSMLAWGDRWLFGGHPPVRLTHKCCGRQLNPILTCSVCTQPISRADVAISSPAVNL